MFWQTYLILITSTMAHCSHDAYRCLQELEALQEMLLHACGNTADSKMLSSRVMNTSDLVTQTLTSLSATTQRPETIWESLQAASARTHTRWAELCMRTMHTAVVCNAKVPYTEWCQTLVTTITSAADVPGLQFRKLGLENQMELVAEVALTDNEVAEVCSSLQNINGITQTASIAEQHNELNLSSSLQPIFATYTTPSDPYSIACHGV